MNNVNNSAASNSVNHSNIITATFGGEQKFLPGNNSTTNQATAAQQAAHDPSSKSESYTGPSHKSSKPMQQDLVMMMADDTSVNEYGVNDDDDYRSGKIKLFANQQHNDDISTDDYKDDELAFRQLHELNLKNKKPM